MSHNEKHLFTALAVSTVIMLVNVIVITNGLADDFYLQLTNWLVEL